MSGRYGLRLTFEEIVAWANENGRAVVALEYLNGLTKRAVEAEALLLRLRQWDHLDGAADGPFWKREIDDLIKRGG